LAGWGSEPGIFLYIYALFTRAKINENISGLLPCPAKKEGLRCHQSTAKNTTASLSLYVMVYVQKQSVVKSLYY
jgi:hypothetical protein